MGRHRAPEPPHRSPLRRLRATRRTTPEQPPAVSPADEHTPTEDPSVRTPPQDISEDISSAPDLPLLPDDATEHPDDTGEEELAEPEETGTDNTATIEEATEPDTSSTEAPDPSSGSDAAPPVENLTAETPDPPTPGRSRWRRQVTGRRAALTALGAFLVVALGTPLLLLAQWISTSPGHLASNPAVHALEAYQQSLDGSPAGTAALAAVHNQLYVRTLPDGTVKASATSPDGTCYYLLVPVQTDLPDSGIRHGTRTDCTG